MLDFKVSFALLLYDEFDGSAIADANVIFRSEGRIITPLRKREGFYVFCGLDTPQVDIDVCRPHYHVKRKRIIKSCLDPGNPVERLRLTRTYPGNFPDCEWLHGSCPPDTGVLAFAGEELKFQIGGDKNRLTILGCAAGSVVGRRFALEKEKGETFLLTGSIAPGVYLTDRKLMVSPKGARTVVRAYHSESGPDGQYHIPVEHGHSEKITGTAYYDRGKEKWVYASATARS